jgi:small-conductance mechanosensitive channel
MHLRKIVLGIAKPESRKFLSRARRLSGFLTLSMLVLLSCASFAVAQEPKTPAEASLDTAPIDLAINKTEVAEKRKAISEKHTNAQKLLKSLQTSEFDERFKSLLERKIRLYEDLDLSYAQMLDAFVSKAELDERKEELDTKDGYSELIPKEKPYQLSALRRVSKEIEQAEIRVARVEDEISILKQSIAQSTELKEEKEREKRRLREDLEKNTSEIERQNYTRELEIISLEIELSIANIELYGLELKNANFTRSLYDEERERLLRIELLIRSDVAFKKTELDATVESVRSRELVLRKRLGQAKRNLIVSDRKYRASNLDKDKMSAVDRARSRAKQAHYERDRSLVTLLTKQIQFVSEQVPVWEDIYTLYQDGVDLETKRNLSSKAKDELKSLRRQNDLDTAKLDELRTELAQINADIEEARENSLPSVRWLIESRKYLRDLRSDLETYIVERRGLENLYEICIEEVDRQVSLVPVEAYYNSLIGSLGELWNYEVTSVEEKPITISKIITALLIFALGVFLSRRFSRRLFLPFLERLNMAEGSASALQSLLFYFLVLIFALTALNVVNVPLTVFTFVGGAFAIGFGFGSQNIMNNFISGIIILVEQPVRRGDIVQLKSLTGMVTHIGLRSTSLRTAENIDIIVPNSTFLESEVVNWTLVDHRIRMTVMVGVAYGSPTEEVRSLLLRAVAEHEKVLSQPSPFVLFSNFGSDSLEFEVVFWSHIASVTQKLQVLSDIRFIIERLFTAEGIVIAFPQRDIHMDTIKPLEVKILGQA